MEVWEASAIATDKHFEDLTFSMFNILTQLQAFDSTRRNLVAISRSVSVELRKILLHDGLLKRCVRRPRLHQLVHPDHLKGDSFEDTFKVTGGNMTITKIDEPMAGAQASFEFAPMEHTTIVHPLYGLSFQEDINRWISENPIDEESIPIRLEQWLKQPILQIDNHIYNMGDLLSEVANTQGAHSDHKNDAIRQQIYQHFHGTYLNIFVLTIGIYLYNHFSVSVSADSSLRRRVAGVHPNIKDEAYRVDAILTFDWDKFSTHGEFTLRPIAVTQQLPIVGGVPPSGVGPLSREPIVSKFEIRVPIR